MNTRIVAAVLIGFAVVTLAVVFGNLIYAGIAPGYTCTTSAVHSATVLTQETCTP